MARVSIVLSAAGAAAVGAGVGASPRRAGQCRAPARHCRPTWDVAAPIPLGSCSAVPARSRSVPASTESRCGRYPLHLPPGIARNCRSWPRPSRCPRPLRCFGPRPKSPCCDRWYAGRCRDERITAQIDRQRTLRAGSLGTEFRAHGVGSEREPAAAATPPEWQESSITMVLSAFALNGRIMRRTRCW